MFTSKANVEDFIWAIRQRHEDIKTEEVRMYAKKSIEGVPVSEIKSKILATLVPDEVIENMNDYSHKHYNACLLFGDVSGFTELTEKYNQQGKGGPSRLTMVLNGYIGALIQEIMSFGGDIFKFSGDAFLAFWKCRDEHQIMREYVHQALDCALVIQKNYGSFETDIGTLLRVKLAIAAGPVIYSLIGNEKYSHYIIIGKPITDVKDAEHRSKAGEIVVAPSAWYHVNATDYISIDTEGMFKKVVGVGPSWRHIKTENKYSMPSEDIQVDNDSTDSSSGEQTKEENEIYMQKKNMEFALRPVMHQAEGHKDGLKKYILPPVMSCIDQNEPIEYLTEMRRAVIMFINIIPKRSSYDALADLVNECYLEICKKAESYRGCVNKVSLFDKDIMFVVLFGLRGFKHDLECRFALKCGSSIFDSLNAHKSIKTVSIACTTGKTYCGIVGHTLRREYTVMSLSANMAARIMVHYPDRVACDSATFQHSKMEAKNFLLQVYKPLKGISNPGPIYEFQESDTIDKDDTASSKVNYYPILGRDPEVKIYKDALKLFVKNSKKEPEDSCTSCTRMLLIKGWPRQGKTRLLEEFIYTTDRAIPMSKYRLCRSDSLDTYGTAKTVMKRMLKINDKTTMAEIKNKITTPLHADFIPSLCCLNRILDVDFKSTKTYIKMTIKEKDDTLSKIIEKLCDTYIHAAWIVTVDNAKFMDEGSWLVFTALFSCRHLFFVVSVDSQFIFGPNAEKLAQHKNVQVIELTNIPRIYHAGLACQILKVFAISADLENLLHTKSNGNAGWIETLLISMEQSHHVFVRNSDYRTINQYGLVAPPLYMMRRMPPENILKWKQLLEEKRSKIRESNIDNWYLYIDTCRDEIVDVVLREKVHKICAKDRHLPVCFMNSNLNLIDLDSELSQESHLIMTFDSLTYQEQLLLKCSSVLGDSFPRSMLIYVMQSTDSNRETAEVVQSLFEKRVLCCAKGDFSEGGNYHLFRSKMPDPSKNTNVVCSCVGIYISDEYRSLPKYASCGYFRFISSKFRQTTYNLLTDAQKKMFHARATKYLLRETRKCSSCGGDFFDLDGYCKVEHQVVKTPRRTSRKSTTSEMSDHSLSQGSTISGTDDSYGDSSASGTQYGKKSYAVSYNRPRAVSIAAASFGGHAGLSPSFESAETVYDQTVGIMNPFKARKLKANYSLTKTFNRADFQTCHCHLILTYLFNQLAYHHRGSGQWFDMIQAEIRYIIICVSQDNYTEGLIYVRNALNFLSTAGENLGIPMWKIPIFEGKLYTWYGVILVSQQQIQEAMKMYHIAMQKFGYSFPRSKITLGIRLWTKKLQHILRLYLFPDKLGNKKMSEDDVEVMDSVSGCLNKMFDVYLQNGKWKQAELAALWSLTRALEAGSSLFQVCRAFRNMILIANSQSKRFLSIVLEIHALRFCHKKKYGIEPPELRSVIRLYYVIFEARLLRAEFEDAIHLGYILCKITIASNFPQMTIATYAQLIVSMVVKLFLGEGMTLMQELAYHMTDADVPEGRAQVYASALFFHLETGYNFIGLKEIEDYYHGECMLGVNPAKRTLLMLLRTWYSRTRQWEAAKLLNEQIKVFPKSTDTTEIALNLSRGYHSIYEIEYQLLLMVHMINKRNIYDRQIARVKLNQLWKKVKMQLHRARMLQPRFYMLKAYEAMIWNNESKMFKYLKICKKRSRKQGHMLQLKYCEFIEEYWTDKLPEEMAQSWFKHSEPDNYMEYNQFNNADYVMFYPFALPIFY